MSELQTTIQGGVRPRHEKADRPLPFLWKKGQALLAVAAPEIFRMCGALPKKARHQTAPVPHATRIEEPPDENLQDDLQ
jgi:hypothetical protein